MTPAQVVKPKGLNCPNCGGPLEVRGFAHTLSIVCPQCLSVLDAKDPNLRVLQKFQAKQRWTPLLPLGTRGKWKGAPYEVIGFQVRTITADGVDYSWDEYLLFNPYQGFRYLTHYRGHWNDARTLRALPEPDKRGSKPAMRYAGEMFVHFQTANARTSFVLGEFPWRVHVGEKAETKDYIAPPRMLSSEKTAAEVVWSLGEYVEGDQIWSAFKLAGRAPAKHGIFADQPSPHKTSIGDVWRMYFWLLMATIVLALICGVFARREEVFRRQYTFSPRSGGEASLVTDVFELKGRPSNVEISTRTDLANNWTYFSFALVNQDTGQAWDFGREVSYYSGRDSDGSWTEGSAGDTAVIPTVPSGRYYLRIEPEMDTAAQPVNYEIRVRRDVPSYGWFWLTGFLLLIPPIVSTFRSVSFETHRWQESDYAP